MQAGDPKVLSEYIVKNRGIVPSSAKDALENYRQVGAWLLGPGPASALGLQAAPAVQAELQHSGVFKMLQLGGPFRKAQASHEPLALKLGPEHPRVSTLQQHLGRIQKGLRATVEELGQLTLEPTV